MRRPVWFTLSSGVVLAALLATGCGGGSSSSTSSTDSGTSAPSGSAMSGSGMQQAPVPANLNCTGAIVWANPSRHNYHEDSDPYYGRTKHGKYMCQSDAVAAGYHPAPAGHYHMGTSPGAMSSPAATP